MSETKRWVDKKGVARTFKDEVARNAIAGKVSTISVNGVDVPKDSNGNVNLDISFPSSPIQSISVNDSAVAPDAQGNVNVSVPVTSVNGKTGDVVVEEPDLSNYVQKDGDKVLSTNDYTTAEKTKLAGIESGAQVNTVTSVNGKIGNVVIEMPDPITIDSVPTEGSTNAVQSGGVYDALQNITPVAEDEVIMTTVDPGEGVASDAKLIIVYSE